jgi:hypothetical protein
MLMKIGMAIFCGGIRELCGSDVNDGYGSTDLNFAFASLTLFGVLKKKIALRHEREPC